MLWLVLQKLAVSLDAKMHAEQIVARVDLPNNAAKLAGQLVSEKLVLSAGCSRCSCWCLRKQLWHWGHRPMPRNAQQNRSFKKHLVLLT